MREARGNLHDSNQGKDRAFGLPAFAAATSVVMEDIGSEFDFYWVGLAEAVDSAATEGATACEF